jgi:predicted metal-dependent hydrolase
MNKVIIKPNKQRKQYSIEINQNAELVIRTPAKSSEKIIRQIINDNHRWIEEKKINQKKINQQLSDWRQPHTIFYRGKKYNLKFTNTLAPIFITNRIYLPNHLTKSTFLQSQAGVYFAERCAIISNQMGLHPKKIRTRLMRSCWGTCNQNKTITLNTSLIQTPDWVSDYVIVHECAHLVHFNHSRSFWNLVSEYCTTISTAKQWLKTHQSVLLLSQTGNEDCGGKSDVTSTGLNEFTI